MIASTPSSTLSDITAQAKPSPKASSNHADQQKATPEPINLTTVLVALIGALATIIAAFFASPVVENVWPNSPPPSEAEVIIHLTDNVGSAIADAKVSLFFEGGQLNKWTYSNGSATFIVPLPDESDELDVSMTIEHDSYQIYNQQIELPREKLVEIRLNKKNKHSAKVIMRAVDDKDGTPLAGTNILLLVEGDIHNQITDSNGIAEFVLPFPEGKIDAKMSITPKNYEAQYQHVTLLPNKVQDIGLSMRSTYKPPVSPTATPVYAPEVAQVPTIQVAPTTMAPTVGRDVLPPVQEPHLVPTVEGASQEQLTEGNERLVTNSPPTTQTDVPQTDVPVINTSPSMQVPSEQVPSEQVSSEQVPSEQVPSEQVPSEQAPSEQVPSEQVPSEQVPSEQVPSEQVPSEQVPGEQVPSEQVPSEQVPSEQVPSEQVPSEVPATNQPQPTPSLSAQTAVPTNTPTEVAPTATATPVPQLSPTAVPATDTPVPATDSEEVAPSATEVALTANEEDTQMESQEVAPMAMNVAPTATEVVPTPTEVVPTPTEEVVPTATEEVVPTPTEVVPTPTEVVPTPTEEVVPTATEEVVPTATEEVVPTATEEVVPIATEEVVPIATEEVVPIATEEVVPIATEEAATVIFVAPNATFDSDDEPVADDELVVQTAFDAESETYP